MWLKRVVCLTESQLVALEKKKENDMACGEIETAYTGLPWLTKHVLCGDTQRCRAGLSAKTPITAADLLNDWVLPFFAEQGIPLLRILTDRGTEYCGSL